MSLWLSRLEQYSCFLLLKCKKILLKFWKGWGFIFPVRVSETGISELNICACCTPAVWWLGNYWSHYIDNSNIYTHIVYIYNYYIIHIVYIYNIYIVYWYKLTAFASFPTSVWDNSVIRELQFLYGYPCHENLTLWWLLKAWHCNDSSGEPIFPQSW